jgi:PAS domain S-box-containing protein
MLMQARIITEARPPFRITHANGPWEKLCGYTADEVMHKAGLSFLQGAATDKKTVERINTAVREGGRIRVTVVNYTKDGTPFFNRLQISPLRSPLGQVTHMLGVLARASDP